MQVSLSERYALIPMLPNQGNFQVLTRLKNLRTLLELGEVEQRERNLAIVNDTIISTDDAVSPMQAASELTDVPMHDELAKIVVSTLKDFEAREALPMGLLALYERLVREPDNEVVREAQAVAQEA